MKVQSKTAHKFAAILLAAAILGACSGGASSNGNGPPDGENGGASSPKDIPKIYIYQNTGALNHKPEGSLPAKLEEMKQMYIDVLGIEPIAIVPPQGSAAEKLNLIHCADRLSGRTPVRTERGCTG